MGLSVIIYLVLLLAVGLGRLAEVGISTRHQRRLIVRGIGKIPEKNFRWMVLLHAGILVSAGLEVLLLRRPFIPVLTVLMSLLFILANLLRWWVILSLSDHWNIHVMASTRLGVVICGPYRWIRHPNYLAVSVELFALPLIHTAWFIALCGSFAHLLVLKRRVAVEESVLLADPAYRAAMGGKPRFVPGLFSRGSGISARRVSV